MTFQRGNGRRFRMWHHRSKIKLQPTWFRSLTFECTCKNYEFLSSSTWFGLRSRADCALLPWGEGKLLNHNQPVGRTRRCMGFVRLSCPRCIATAMLALQVVLTTQVIYGTQVLIYLSKNLRGLIYFLIFWEFFKNIWIILFTLFFI